MRLRIHAVLTVRGDSLADGMAAQAESTSRSLYGYIEKSIIFAKIFRLGVCSICQYLPRPGAVRARHERSAAAALR